MASSKCPSCSSHSFELKILEPSGSNYKVSAVQCSSCGAVVGILEYTRTEYLFEQLSSEIKQLQHRNDVINQKQAAIMNKLNS